MKWKKKQSKKAPAFGGEITGKEIWAYWEGWGMWWLVGTLGETVQYWGSLGGTGQYWEEKNQVLKACCGLPGKTQPESANSSVTELPFQNTEQQFADGREQFLPMATRRQQ